MAPGVPTASSPKAEPMKMSLMLPTHAVDSVPEFIDPAVIATLARRAEAAGFDAVHVTDHPFPPAEWVASGGHHALDPFVTLAVVAAATESLRLHTHLVVGGYRNPFLLAKAASTLDVLSRGRLILGLGAGYLEGEFDALGANFGKRNADNDEVVAALLAAWSGEPVHQKGMGWEADGNAMLPRPLQWPRPPIWIGGNSSRAQRRAVELGDGWAPFPAGDRGAGLTRTARMSDAADIAAAVASIAELAAERGRVEPLEIVFAPLGSRTFKNCADAAMVIEGAGAMKAAGVTYFTIEFPARSRHEYEALIELYGEKVLPAVADL
jgi:probable F420-dependent oxidoreductase